MSLSSFSQLFLEILICYTYIRGHPSKSQNWPYQFSQMYNDQSGP